MTDQAYSDAELTAFQTQIEEKLEKENALLEDLNQQRMHHGDKDDHNASYGDDGKTDQILSRLAGLIEKKMNDIQQLEAALVRIENKTYGLDINTGEKIEKARLEAELTATTNI